MGLFCFFLGVDEVVGNAHIEKLDFGSHREADAIKAADVDVIHFRAFYIDFFQGDDGFFEADNAILNVV